MGWKQITRDAVGPWWWWVFVLPLAIAFVLVLSLVVWPSDGAAPSSPTSVSAASTAVAVTAGEERVDVTGTISSLSSSGDAISFVPDDTDLIEDGDSTVAGYLVNRSNGPVESGQEFTGYWLPDESILVIEAD